MPDFVSRLRHWPTHWMWGVALVLGFALLYMLQGSRMMKTEVYTRDDVLFRSDTRRVFLDLTTPKLDTPEHTSAHPCFVLLHHPLGTALAKAIQSIGDIKGSEARKRSAQLITTVAATGTVLIIYLALLAMGLAASRAALFAAITGASSAMLIMASIPETYTFSSLGLAMLAWLTARGTSGTLSWIAAAAYALANLTSNAVQVGLMALARCWEASTSAFDWWRRSTLIAACAVFTLVPLSLLQKQIYPDTQVFFLPASAATQQGWLYWENWRTPLRTIRIVLQHHILSNIVAPDPITIARDSGPMKSIEEGAWPVVTPTLLLALLWLGIAAVGAVALARAGQRPPVVGAMVASVVFSLLFFTVFGHDRMLYASVWTPSVVMLVALGWERFALVNEGRWAKAMLPPVLLLVGLLAHGWRWIGLLG